MISDFFSSNTKLKRKENHSTHQNYAKTIPDFLRTVMITECIHASTSTHGKQPTTLKPRIPMTDKPYLIFQSLKILTKMKQKFKNPTILIHKFMCASYKNEFFLNIYNNSFLLILTIAIYSCIYLVRQELRFYEKINKTRFPFFINIFFHSISRPTRKPLLPFA